MTKRLPLLICFLGILLRIIPVWAMPTWYDENFTILVARLPLDRMMQAVAGDVHPPLWYLICWPLAHIPGLPAWVVIRLPALIFSILAIWVFWLILQKTSLGNNTRLVAFGLFCVIPQQIYYAQEGRMYSLLTLLVLTAWLCILDRRWIWLSVITTAMLYLHNYGLIYAVTLWVAAIVYWGKFWAAVTWPMAASAVAYLPWLFVLTRQMGGIQGQYWIQGTTLPNAFNYLVNSFFGVGLLKANVVNFTVFWGVMIWMVIWYVRTKHLFQPQTILVFLPWMLVAIASITWQPIMLSRALIPSGAFTCLFLAYPLETMGRRYILLLSVFFIPALIVNLLSTELRSHWGVDTIHNTRQAIDLIDSNWRPGDLLYYADDGFFVSGSVYWQNIDYALRVEPCGPVKGGLSSQTRRALGIQTGLPETVPNRIWVITGETPLNPSCEQEHLVAAGLLDGDPLFCPQDNELVRSCVYLVVPP